MPCSSGGPDPFWATWTGQATALTHVVGPFMLLRFRPSEGEASVRREPTAPLC